MAPHHHSEQLELNDNALSLLDALFCDEGKWEEEDGELSQESDVINNDGLDTSLFPMLSFEQDLFWADEEINSLFSKEQQQEEAYSYFNILENEDFDSPLYVARREAVEWMLKVNAHYGFSALTATLAIAYLDRFIVSFRFQREKPWMIQLVAVACLSLAAKVEETQVPLLLDLQVDDTKYVYKAKTVKRMELLVLSTLKWKMHPVTPLSFLEHILSRLGLKTNLHEEFRRRCENLLLSVLLDSRLVGCLPSVLATATLLHVIDQIEHSDGMEMEYKNQFLGVLKISKEKVEDCYNAILQLSNVNKYAPNLKRPYERIPGSPSGVIHAAFSSDGSNDSWTVRSSLYSSREPLFKKSRAREQQMKLSPLNRVVVGIVGSSP